MNDNEPLLKMDDFNGGVVDAFGQGKEPENSFSDSQNFTPFLKHSLMTVHGYSKTGGLASLPTGFPIAGSTGTYNAAKIVSEIYPFSSANPVAYDGRVYYFQDNQGSPVNHVMLDTWFKSSTTPQAAHGGFVALDETGQFSGGANVTIAGASTHTITIANANSAYGLSTTNLYYTSPCWLIVWKSGASYSYATVVNYLYSAGTATITTKEDIGSSHLNWTTQAGGDTFTLRRWFHRLSDIAAPNDINTAALNDFVGPNFGTVPGQCFQSFGRIRGCGGTQGTMTMDYSPWIAQYINRTFLTNHPSAPETYQGTYVDEMRCRAPLVGGIVAAASAPGGVTVLLAGTYKFYMSYEFDGYEEGELSYQSSAVADGTTNIITYDLSFNFAQLNKRVTALNVYVSQTTSGVETDPYFLKRFDIVNPTSAQVDTTYGWRWEYSPGNFVILAAGGSLSNANYQVLVDGNAWNSKGGSYISRTGRVFENGAKDYVFWQYTENVSGRQFFGNFFDPNTGIINGNALKFTGFDINSAGTNDIIPNDPLFNQTNVSPGTGQAIQGLAGQNGWLYVFLNPGIYGFSITAYPEQWVKYPVSLIDGLYSAKSLGKLPEGNGIYFADVDHLKLMNNQKITALTVGIPNLYYNLTNKSTVRAWYDKLDRAICFSNGVSGQHYRGYPELSYPLTGNYLTGNLSMGIPWFPSKYLDNIEFVTMLRDASIVFTNQTLNGVFQVHLADQTFNGSGIIPYLKTNSKFLDDKDQVSKGIIDRVHIHLFDIGDAGQFDCKLTLDANSYTWSSIDKTKGHLFLKVPATTQRQGRHMYFEINTNAGGLYDDAGDIQLTQIVFYGQLVRFFPKNEA